MSATAEMATQPSEHRPLHSWTWAKRGNWHRGMTNRFATVEHPICVDRQLRRPKRSWSRSRRSSVIWEPCTCSATDRHCDDFDDRDRRNARCRYVAAFTQIAGANYIRPTGFALRR